MKLFEHFKKFTDKNENDLIKDSELNRANEQTNISIEPIQRNIFSFLSNLKTKQNPMTLSSKETNKSLKKQTSNFCFDNYAYGSLYNYHKPSEASSSLKKTNETFTCAFLE